MVLNVILWSAVVGMWVLSVLALPSFGLILAPFALVATIFAYRATHEAE